MNTKIEREWKKVFEEDLSYITFELKETIQSPALIILKGELGAGKTTFCKNFSGDAKLLSPTYSVLSETEKILHADFYRIKEIEEIYLLELELYLEDKSYFFAEWGEKYAHVLGKIIPENYGTFLLEINVNERLQGSNKQQSRDFILKSISLID